MTKFQLLTAAAAVLAVPAISATTEKFSPQRLSDIDKIISSDAFEGRGPATRAETKTINYIADQFRAVGLQPAGDIVNGKRSWFQNVPLLKSEIAGNPQFTLNLGNGQTIQLTQGNEIALKAPLNGAERRQPRQCAAGLRRLRRLGARAQLGRFQGRQDVRGKLLVVLINDPDFEGGEGDFGGKAMTYYGRWTYKYEEAARRGAAGVLIVHETDPASYGWNTVKNSNTNAQFDIVRQNPAASHTAFESWIQRHARASRSLPRRASISTRRRPRRGRSALPADPAQGDAHRQRASAMSRPSPRTMSSAICPARNIPDETVIYSRALGPSRHRQARRARRHDLQWRARQRDRHRPADRAGARLRPRAAHRPLGRLPRRHGRGKGPARLRILCARTRSSRSARRPACSTPTAASSGARRRTSPSPATPSSTCSTC